MMGQMSVTVSAFAFRECGFNPPGFESRRSNGSDFLIRPESSGDRFSIKPRLNRVASGSVSSSIQVMTHDLWPSGVAT